HLESRDRPVAAGLVRFRAAVPVDARGRASRDQLVALPADHGGVPVCNGLRGRLCDLPRGPRAWRWLSMAALQSILVALIVSACVIYSAWRLTSARFH